MMIIDCVINNSKVGQMAYSDPIFHIAHFFAFFLEKTGPCANIEINKKKLPKVEFWRAHSLMLLLFNLAL